MSRSTSIDVARQALVDWEPAIDLEALSDCPRLYEPDGTLYVVCLSAEATLVTDRREVNVRAGDLIILPRAVGLDVLPGLDAIALRHDGPQPFHFRERFIQVWTFEHVAAPAKSADLARHTLLKTSELRHRTDYAVVDVGADVQTDLPSVDRFRLIVAIEGSLEFPGEPTPLPIGAVLALQPGQTGQIGGEGRFAEFSLVPEFVHQSASLDRRREAARTSPEFGTGPART